MTELQVALAISTRPMERPTDEHGSGISPNSVGGPPARPFCRKQPVRPALPDVPGWRAPVRPWSSSERPPRAEVRKNARGVCVARWYDPVTGQFMTVDPLVAETEQAFAYSGDDPVNEEDPTGLAGGMPPEGECSAGGNKWVPNGTPPNYGTCIQEPHHSLVNEVGHDIGTTATRVWNSTGGRVVHQIATGTFGICISGTAGWGPGGIVQGCFVESSFFHHGGFIGTLGGGGQSPTAGIDIGFLSSNASSPGQLSRWFGYTNVSAVVGPDVGAYVGTSGFIGNDSCNSTIFGSVSSVGLGADLPLPFSYGAGGSYTWVGQLW
jgi:hypothetical protein